MATQGESPNRARPRPEFWIPAGPLAMRDLELRVRTLETDGWDGFKVWDTQCLHPDPFVAMTVAALATTRLRFSISASNPATRHPATAAAAITSLAEIAPGRVGYGIGRGDSALAHVGGAPAPVAMFEQYLIAVRAYLRGDGVPFDDIAPWRLTADVSTIELGHAPEGSRLVWPRDATQVPIEVFATGPKAIGVGARHADRLTVGVGAHPERVRWAIDTAREAREKAGLDSAAIEIGAIVCVGAFDDLNRARRSIANVIASTARFAVMSGKTVGPLSPTEREVYDDIAARYDMDRHGGMGDQVNALTDEFVDDYAIVGHPERCAERMIELYEMGVDSFQVAPPLGEASERDRIEGYRHFVDDVMPRVRAAVG